NADAPWRLLRDAAISLDRDEQSLRAAAAILDGLIAFTVTVPLSAELAELLQNDRRALQRRQIRAEIDRNVSEQRWGRAAALVDQLIAIADQNEHADLAGERKMFAARSRSRQAKTLLRSGAAALFILVAQDHRPIDPTIMTAHSEPAAGQRTVVAEPPAEQ